MDKESLNAVKLDEILTLLKNFLNGEIFEITSSERTNPILFHYYNEIIRYWSKLNFIIKKTLRSLNHFNNQDIIEIEKCLYFAYRIIWEAASNDSILKELKVDETPNNKKYSNFFNKLRSFSWDKALEGKSPEEKLSIEEAIPSFVIQHLSGVMSLDMLKNNIVSMNSLDKTYFTAYIKGNIQNLLISENFKKDKEIENLYHYPNKFKSELLRSKLYQSGDLIILDKGSAAIVNILEPKINEKICDICAAPGIKTNLIAHITTNKARIIAGDFHTERVKIMKKLLLQLKNNNVHILNEDSITFPIRFENYFDRILIDAPCTGSGTFLNNPELKWRQNEGFLHQNITLQKKLFKTALKLLRPNGILVYSTCSLYPEEGEYIILDYLEQLEPLNLPKWFSPSYSINNSHVPGTGRLFPSIHNTQGFFIGKFKKKDL